MTWRTVDGYAAGTSHLASQTGCQDRSRIARIGEAVVVAVVADGAGSAARAERGAELVCDGLLDAIARDVRGDADLDALDDDAVRAWFTSVRERIAADAGANERDVRDYAATALVCVAGSARTICAQIGDGGIVVRPRGGEAFAVAIWPENGEYANQTFFVTDADATERLSIAHFGAVDDLAVFSDGLMRLALDLATRSAFVPFFEPLTRTVREAPRDGASLAAELVAYLGSDAVNARTDDDKALAIGVRLADVAAHRRADVANLA
jgi:hypothetical protein